MAKTLNATFIKYAKPIAKQYREAGKNWDWAAQGAALVKTILEEFGNVEEATSPDHKESRAEMVELVKMLNFPKNCQESYLAKIDSGEVDADGNAVMVMPKVASAKVVVEDFV